MAGKTLVTSNAGALSGIARWLTAGDDAVYTVLHTPRDIERRDTAVLILPPFGWEEVCSYSARRYWAGECARRGFVTARIDLPGAGDSSGDAFDSDLLGRWDTATRTAIDWIRGLPGITRLAVIGIRLGGMLACRALASGAPIDDLVSWGTTARGRAYLRELKVHSDVVETASGESEELKEIVGGGYALTGFRVTPATIAAMEAVKLTELDLPELSGRRALMIERDRLGVDEKLSARLADAGAAVRVLPAHDYRLLMGPPLEAGTPRESIARTIDWLDEASSRAAPGETSSADVAGLRDRAELSAGGGRVSERIVDYDGAFGRTAGILCCPDGAPSQDGCILFLAPGRRTGPNRMWTEAARRWAAHGYAAARFDVEGLGDSDGDPDLQSDQARLHSPAMIEQVIEIIDHLESLGAGDRFFVVGLCASAYWALHAALLDGRLRGLVLLNLLSIRWSQRLMDERDRERSAALLGDGFLRRLRLSVEATGTREIRRAARAHMATMFRSRSTELNQKPMIEGTFDALANAGTEVSMIFSRSEALYSQLERLELLQRLPDWPSVVVEQLPAEDHNIRALGVQQLIHDRIDATLRQQLAVNSPDWDDQ